VRHDVSAHVDRQEQPRPRHLLRVANLAPAEVEGILTLAAQLKVEPAMLAGAYTGEAVVAIFELPSTRTRLAFAAAAQRLGLAMTPLGPGESQLVRGEAAVDTARTLSALSAIVVVRTNSDELLEDLAAAASVPVVNALTPRHHPCEAVVSLLTLRERFGGLSGLKLAFVGVGNNVAHSLLEAAAAAGMEIRLACPAGHGPSDDVVMSARKIAATTTGSISVLEDPREAVAGVDVVYTDVWTSMADEASVNTRPDFGGFQVDRRLMRLAANHVVFLHPLPARRGVEVTADVLDGPCSLVWRHVANQIPVIQALVHSLLARSRSVDPSAIPGRSD
jgi:ornithine carbamoyltransferase